MAYVYLMYDYGEYGPDEICATLDRGKVIDLLKAHKHPNEPEALPRLEECLTLTDEVLARDGGDHSLMRGWGGIVLHVLELDAPP